MTKSHWIFIFVLVYMTGWLVTVTVHASEARNNALQLVEDVEGVLGHQVIVTGLERSPRRQAELFYKRKKAGSDLFIWYHNRQVVDDILAVKTVGQIEIVIRHYMKYGYYISSHICGEAIDIRSRNLTLYERMQIVDKLNSVGGYQAIDERSPPHIHIERTKGCSGED